MQQVFAESFDRFLDDAIVPDEPARRATRVDALADRYREIGLRPGDIVLVALPNGGALLRHVFALLAADAVPALLPGTGSAARIDAVRCAFGARAVVARGLGYERFPGSRHAIAGEMDVLLFDAYDEEAAAPGEIIVLTSGTSGIASGCVFDWRALLRNAERHAGAIGLRADDGVLINLPLHFSYAFVAQMLAAYVAGARIVVTGPPFHSVSYLETIRQARITVSSLTPTLVRQLLAREVPREALRVLTVGGDRLRADEVRVLLAREIASELYVTYGLTEAGPRVATLAAHRADPSKFASVGVPLPGTQVELRSPSAPNGIGELLIRSDTVMRRKIGVVETRRSADWAAPGVLATGDLFTIDGDGYLSYEGRLSDHLVRNGEKVALASIRRIAASLPGVVSARVRIVDANGSPDFVLELGVREGLAQREVYSALRRLVRTSEMPASIVLRPGDGDEPYK